jgi:two-component system response regulator VicR
VNGADPLAHPASQADRPATVAEATTPAVAGPPVVLIVEDEAPIADAIALVVEDAGYVALVAAHGAQALEMLRSRFPALITTDFMMPNMNGDQFIEAVHQEAQARGVSPPPIILITAIESQRMRAIPADAFLPKPFDVDDLTVLLHRFLRGTNGIRADGAQPT